MMNSHIPAQTAPGARHEGGMTLISVLVALLIFAFSLLALAGYAAGAIAYIVQYRLLH